MHTHKHTPTHPKHLHLVRNLPHFPHADEFVHHFYGTGWGSAPLRCDFNGTRSSPVALTERCRVMSAERRKFAGLLAFGEGGEVGRDVGGGGKGIAHRYVWN